MELSCNNPHCRTTLSSGPAFVTYCCHIFCDPCGRTILQEMACMACRTSLQPTGLQHNEAPKVRKMNLQLRKEDRAMLLAGQTPGTILEMAWHGMAFYNNQVKEEMAFLQTKLAKLNNKFEQMKQFNDQVIMQFKTRVTGLQLEIEEFRRPGRNAPGMKTENYANAPAIFSPPTNALSQCVSRPLTRVDFPSSSGEQPRPAFGLEFGQRDYGHRETGGSMASRSFSQLQGLVCSVSGMGGRGGKRSRPSTRRPLGLVARASSSHLWPDSQDSERLF